MSFDAKFYREAEKKLEERRAKNERTLERREKEIAEKFPEIMDIQRELSLTGARLIELILNKDGDFERRFAELESNNLFLQDKIKESLIKKGYPADHLDIPHDCKICSDTGIANGRRCSCFMELVKQLAADELNKSSPLSLCDFSDFDLDYYDDREETAIGCTARYAMENNLGFCVKYAEDFHIPYGSLCLWGGTGLGKTHLSLSIARVVLEKGYSVIYGSVPDLFRKMEQEHFGRAEGDTQEALEGADLLILDDVGAEFESKFNTAALYGIINNRMNAALPTVISTNCDPDELRERYGERTASRISAMEQLTFVGSDVRSKKKSR